jgi:hypothetical protein
MLWESLMRRHVGSRKSPAPPDQCRTPNAGHLDIHRDSKRVLMTITHQGALWEVNPETGAVEWEYIYVHPGKKGRREPIYTAKYVYQAGFLTEREKS